MSQQNCVPSHEVFHSNDSSIEMNDVVMFLEPYFDQSTRSVPVFKMIIDAMMSINDLIDDEIRFDYPITFRFLTNEYTKFVGFAKDNIEVSHILMELCTSLKSLSTQPLSNSDQPVPKRSIIDPGFVKVIGPQSTSTSSKVDNKAIPPRTKMVEAFRTTPSPSQKIRTTSKRKNKCSVCLCAGHQARTCPDILRTENIERADEFFKKLLFKGKKDSYLKTVTKRMSRQDVETITERIDKVMSGQSSV